MKPGEIGRAVEQIKLGELRRLQAEKAPTVEELVAKRAEDLTLVNPYLAEMAETYDEGDSKVASVLYAQSLTLFCREFWKKGLVYTEPIKVGEHAEEGIGTYDVRAQLVMSTNTEGLPEYEYVKPNQRYNINVSIGTGTMLDVQTLTWNQRGIEISSPDFLDWAKLMLESAQNPANAPAMYHPTTIERVDAVNSEGKYLVMIPRVSPIEDPRHILQYLEEQRATAAQAQAP